MLEMAVEYIKDLQKQVKVTKKDAILEKVSHEPNSLVSLFPCPEWKVSVVFWCRRFRMQKPNARVQAYTSNTQIFLPDLVSVFSSRKFGKASMDLPNDCPLSM